MATIPEKRKIFSIPLNPYLTAEDYNNIFLPFVKQYKDWIYDIYFTSRIPPFMQDAMGANFDQDGLVQMFQNAMVLQEQSGVRVSATYNNINVPSTYENLEIFMDNLQYLYNQGLRSVTIPHTQWMLTGKLQERFPDLQIKNTVLRKVKTAQDFWTSAEAGFDYVNLDRALLRDQETLKKIKKAQIKYHEKTGKYIPVALLANEGCRGKCPAMDEHYTVNNSSGSGQPGTDKPYFYQKISAFTCPKWRMDDPAYQFKVANIPPYRKDFEELLEYVDVFKMHGREGHGLLSETLEFIKSYVMGDEELTDISVRSKIENLDIPTKQVEKWREHIKTCQFECWDCEMCDNLVKGAQHKQEKKMDANLEKMIANYKKNNE